MTTTDDDELFTFDTGLTRKKQPPQETSAATPRNPYQKSHLQQTSGNASAAAQKPAAAPKNKHTIRRKSAPGAATTYAREQRKKAPPAALAHRKSAPPPQAPNDDDDSEDDDDLFNFSTGLLRPASASSKRAAASSAVSQQIVVTNPYLPSKPRASFAAAAAATPASRPIPFPYPKLTERAKQYPDERARFLLAFWQYARANCTRRSFERPKLDAVAKRVVRLAVGTDHPVRSLEELVRTSGGTGSSSVNAYNKVRDDFRQELAQGGFDRLITPVVTTAPTTSTSSSSSSNNQRYYSISEACLVTLLMHAETARGPGSGTTDELLPAALVEKENWMALVDMIPAIDRKLLPVCPGRLTRRDDPDWGAEHYLQQSTRSMEFLQVSKLESKDVGPFIKRHSVKGSIHYELLPAGYERALRIRTRQFPEPEGHYRCSKIRSLQEVDPKYPNICLGVDLREGGGGAKTLHQMCNTLEMMKCPYFVGSLSIGDYVFFTSKNDGGASGGRMDYLCPILVERKSIQDVAMSIHDGRWTSQKQRMYKAQYVFGYENCRMVYIIEGNENKQTVNGGYVGARWYNVDKEKLHKEIENLEKEGFDVLRTTSVENSMMELSRWVSRVARNVADGTMKSEYTYAEFKDQVAKIPKQTDFSRLAKYHVEQKAEREAAAAAAAAADDSDIEVWSNAGDHNAAASRGSSGKKPAPSAGSLQQKRPAKKRKSSANGGGYGSDDYSGCSQEQKRPAKKRKSNDNGGLVGGGGDGDIDYSAWETKALKAECEAVGLKKSGTRDECIQLLKGPRPPAVWLERKRMKEYVPPRHNVAATALLVALHLHEQAAGPGDSGMTKDELYVKAESLNITKVSICSVCSLVCSILVIGDDFSLGFSHRCQQNPFSGGYVELFVLWTVFKRYSLVFSSPCIFSLETAGQPRPGHIITLAGRPWRLFWRGIQPW